MVIQEKRTSSVTVILEDKMTVLKNESSHACLTKMPIYLITKTVVFRCKNQRSQHSESSCGKNWELLILLLVRLHFVDQIKVNTLITISTKICSKKWDIEFVIQF